MFRASLFLSLLVFTIPGQSASQPPAEVLADCILCHGTDGRGNEPVAAPRLAGVEAWYLERQLEAFRMGWRGSHPEDDQGREMRPMAVMLDDDLLPSLAAWFAEQDTPDPSPTLTGRPARGAQLYSLCATCHGTKGEGNRSLGAPALAGQNDWYLARQLHLYRNQQRGHEREDIYGQQMLAMIGPLVDDQAVLDVVAYINTFTE